MFNRILAVLVSFLPILAYAQETAVQEAPTPTVDPIFVVIFGLLFIGGIAYFFYLLWRGERKGGRGDGK